MITILMVCSLHLRGNLIQCRLKIEYISIAKMKKNDHEKDTLFRKIMKIITVTLYLLINCTCTLVRE